MSVGILPDFFGMAVTVDDIDEALRFYTLLCPHDQVNRGVYAGIPFCSIMRDGETMVNIFLRVPGNPLRDVVPMLMVDSVSSYLDTVVKLGGDIVLSEAICPCTSTPFAVVTDSAGMQLLIKQPSRCVVAGGESRVVPAQA